MLIHTICGHQMCHWEVHKFLSRKLLHVECQSFVLKWQHLPPEKEEQRQCLFFLYHLIPIWIMLGCTKCNRQRKTNRSICSVYFPFFFAKELWNLWKSISRSVHLERVWSRPAEDLTFLGFCGLLYEDTWLQGCQQMVVGRVSFFYYIVEYASRNFLPNTIFENKLVHLNALTSPSSRFLCHKRQCRQFSGCMVLFSLAGKRLGEIVGSGYFHLKAYYVLCESGCIYI